MGKDMIFTLERRVNGKRLNDEEMIEHYTAVRDNLAAIFNIRKFLPSEKTLI